MELALLLAPFVSKLLSQREPHALEEATRALRWLLIEPEDPAMASAGTSAVPLPSKVQRVALLLISMPVLIAPRPATCFFVRQVLWMPL